MFVTSNTLSAIKRYFNDRMSDKFTTSELKSMFNQLAQDRLNCSTAELLLSNDRRLSESDLLYFRSAVKRLQQNEPFQHILGHTEFYGLKIKVNENVLIPRPETEELVQWVNETIEQRDSIKIVDVCTGSGCIALALKKSFPSAEVVATDFSTGALKVAEENAKLNDFTIPFLHHDALSFTQSILPEAEHADVWVSNPPYIPQREKASMAEHVVDFEPHMALFVADSDPLCFYDALAKGALRHLRLGGWLFVEIHEDLADQVVNLFEENGLTQVEVKKDLQGKNRMVRGRKE